MASSPPPEDEDDARAGPSGLDPHEMMSLLGLEMPDSEPEEEETPANSCVGPLLCPEDIPDSDEICEEALDRFERQRAFKPISFNKLVEVWMPIRRVSSSLNSNPMSIV